MQGRSVGDLLIIIMITYQQQIRFSKRKVSDSSRQFALLSAGCLWMLHLYDIGTHCAPRPVYLFMAPQLPVCER